MRFIKKATAAVGVVVLLALLGLPCSGFAEMYSWTDANGVRHFSNDPPPKGTQASSSWKEIVAPQPANSKQSSDSRLWDRDVAPDENETRVIVLGNAVIVPVTFGYQGRRIKAQLLLDTGAAHTVYFETAATRKNIVDFKPIKGRVAGGGEIRGQGVKVEYLQVGPKKQPNVKVFVIKQVGSTSGADGLLGMNFLKHFKHYVDLERKVIVWLKK